VITLFYYKLNLNTQKTLKAIFVMTFSIMILSGLVYSKTEKYNAPTANAGEMIKEAPKTAPPFMFLHILTKSLKSALM